MRARARGSRPIAFGVGSTTVRPPACLNSEISSWATCSSRSRKLSRLALKFWRTQPRLARLTGSHARPLSLAAAGSANITLKSIKRCSCGSVMPIASRSIAPSTVWIWPPSGRGIPLAELGRDLRDEPVEVAAQLVERAEHARNEERVDPRGLEMERGVGELVVVSLERRALLGPQRAHHLARLVEPLEPLAHRVERDPVRLVLVLLPAGAEPQQEPTARDDVDLRGHLRDERGVAIRVAEHDGPDAHSRHQRPQRRQRAPRLEHGALALLRVRHEVVGHACDVPLRRLQVAPEVQQSCPGLGAHTRENAEAHVDLLLDFAGPSPPSTPILPRPLQTIAGGVGPGGTVRAFYNVSPRQSFTSYKWLKSQA